MPPKLILRYALEYEQALKDRRRRVITAEEYNQRKTAVLEKQARHNEKLIAKRDARELEKEGAKFMRDLLKEDERQARRDARELEKEGTRYMKQLLKEDAKQERVQRSIASRTYLVTITANKDTLIVKTRGKNNKRLRDPINQREFSQAGAFTHSFTMVREPGETTAKFMERVEKEKRDYIDNLNKNMYDTAGNANEAGEESYVSYSGATVSISQGGGGSSGMSRAKPYNYEFQQYASIVDDGNCVPQSLHILYPKFSLERIMEEMGGEGPKTCEQVLEWCQQKDITCIGCDDKYNVLVEYYSKNRNRTPLYFVNKDNHFYLMDKSKGVSIANSRSNARKTETKKEKAKVEYDIVHVDDLELIDFKATNKHYVVSSTSKVKNSLYKYINELHSVPSVQFSALNSNTVFIKSYVFGDNCKVSIDKHHKLINNLNVKLNTNEKSIGDIIKKMFAAAPLPTSFMNKIVMDIFMNWKQRQHYAHLVTPEAWNDVYGVEQTWDANKQYTGALLNMPCGWLVFDMFSLPTAYSGGVKDAYYYIETSNTMPCKGNGWYSRIILQWLIDNNEEYEVKYEIVGSTLPSNTFKPFVEKAMELTNDFKYITNTLCGSLNTHSVKTVRGSISANKPEIISKCMTSSSHFLNLTDEIFACASIEIQIKNNNNMPMYAQVLDYASIQLANAIKHLEAKGCVIRGYNTDSVTFKYPELLEIDLSKEKIGGWKNEEPKPFEYMLPPVCNRKHYTFEEPEWVSEMTEDDFGSAEDIVEHIVTKNQSVSLDGQAGFGKSYLLNKIIEKVGRDNCVVLGYTNISANNVGGKTFHNTFKIDVASGMEKFDAKKVLVDKKWLIIDEKSQVPSELYRICQTAAEMNIPIIMAGDFAQILPIGQSAGRHSAFLKLVCKNLITLTKYKRGDTKLLSLLKNVRDRIKISGFDMGEKGTLHFCFTKAKRDHINKREMDKINSAYMNMPKNTNISKVYIGLPLRSCVTKENGDWLNNERWTVTGFNKYSVSIKNDTKAHVVPIEIFINSFVPGYAMTIHSSQGLTIVEPYTVWIEQFTAFQEDDVWRLIYTALSRATTCEQIGIVRCK